jgi:hypothetical protein
VATLNGLPRSAWSGGNSALSSAKQRSGENRVNRTPVRRALLVHVHVPKAGGTSLDGVLQAVYGDRLLISHPDLGWPQQWSNLFLQKIEQEGDRYDAFSAHAAYGVHEIFKRPGLYISTVRDPIERFESYFNFVRHWQIHHYHDVAKEMSISEFFRFLDGRDDIELYNLQCLLLCGKKDSKQAIDSVRSRYCAILPLKYFDACVPLLARKLGWPDTEVPHHNVSEHKSTVFEMSHAERAALIEGNRADAELVSFCEGQLPLWYN